MALEVRYVPMADEGDNDIPKIMKVIYKDGESIGYSVAPLDEAAIADPSVVEAYFNLIKEYFTSLASYFDAQTEFNNDTTLKMMQIMAFCMSYIEARPIQHNFEG
jgi:hypothetical protein